MTLDKAIEILTLMGKPEFVVHTEDILAARKLGIEALKEVKKHKSWPLHLDVGLLPGEDPE